MAPQTADSKWQHSQPCFCKIQMSAFHKLDFKTTEKLPSVSFIPFLSKGLMMLLPSECPLKMPLLKVLLPWIKHFRQHFVSRILVRRILRRHIFSTASIRLQIKFCARMTQNNQVSKNESSYQDHNGLQYCVHFGQSHTCQ